MPIVKVRHPIFLVISVIGDLAIRPSQTHRFTFFHAADAYGNFGFELHASREATHRDSTRDGHNLCKERRQACRCRGCLAHGRKLYVFLLKFIILGLTLSHRSLWMANPLCSSWYRHELNQGSVWRWGGPYNWYQEAWSLLRHTWWMGYSYVLTYINVPRNVHYNFCGVRNSFVYIGYLGAELFTTMYPLAILNSGLFLCNTSTILIIIWFLEDGRLASLRWLGLFAAFLAHCQYPVNRLGEFLRGSAVNRWKLDAEVISGHGNHKP